MKLIVDLYNDKLKSIYKSDKVVDQRKNCYIIEVDSDFNATKFVKKGHWKQLTDENGKLLWDKSSLLKPLMGFELSNEEVEIDVFNNIDFWKIGEILEIKYRNKLNVAEKYSHIFFEEFIDLDKIATKGSLNIGKRICFGDGEIIHDISLENNKIVFDCEYDGKLPKLEISVDGKKFAKIEDVPYTRDFRSFTFNKFYLKINDKQNSLKAYSICFNGKRGESGNKVLEKK